MKTSPEPINNSSYWDHKPWWCQPWSIIITGIIILILSWLISHIILINFLILIGVFCWWGLFLFLAPYAYSQQAINKD